MKDLVKVKLMENPMPFLMVEKMAIQRPAGKGRWKDPWTARKKANQMAILKVH